MFKKTRTHRVISFGITLMVLISLLTIQVSAETASDSKDATYVFAGSDFQHPSGGSYNEDVIKEILGSMHEDGLTDPYGILFCGDYNDHATNLQNAVNATFQDLSHKVYVQGNHDYVYATETLEDEPIAESGNNDPEDGNGPYSVFVLNAQEFPEAYYPSTNLECYAKTLEEVQERTEAVAELLEEYLSEKIQSGYTKPIFIVAHLPLHVTTRTYQGMSSETKQKSYATETHKETTGLYAKTIVDVLNAAGECGLNIIYLYGHDHNFGFDSVVGGDCTYLAKGEEIRYANGGTPDEVNVESATLNFTYLNAGFTGYYWYDKTVTKQAGTLTMTLFKITDDTVEVYRYSQEGRYVLARIPYYSDSVEDEIILGYTDLPTLEEAGGTAADLTTVATKIGTEGAVITLNKEIDRGYTISGYLAGSVVGLVLVAVVITVVVVVKKSKKAKVQ